MDSSTKPSTSADAKLSTSADTAGFNDTPAHISSTNSPEEGPSTSNAANAMGNSLPTDGEVSQMWSKFDENLENTARAHNLSAVNVKSILNQLCKNHPTIVSIIMGIEGGEAETTLPSLKVTRSQAKTIKEKMHQEVNVDLKPVPAAIVQNAPKRFGDIAYDNTNEEEGDEEYDPNTAVVDDSDNDSYDMSDEDASEGDEITDAEASMFSMKDDADNELDDNSKLEATETEEERREYELRSRANLNHAAIYNELADTNDDLCAADEDGDTWRRFITDVQINATPTYNNNLDLPDDGDDTDYNPTEDMDKYEEEAEEFQVNRLTEIPKREVFGMFRDVLDEKVITDLIPSMVPIPRRKPAGALPRRPMGFVKSLAEVPVTDASCTLLRGTDCITFHPSELEQLKEQLEQHVQLLAQSVIVCHLEPHLAQPRNQYQTMINELDTSFYESKCGENSYFNIANMPGAILDCHEILAFEQVPPENFNWSTVCHKGPFPRPEVCALLSRSTAVLYPQLVDELRPQIFNEERAPGRLWTEIDGQLLAAGLCQFGHIRHNSPVTNIDDGRYDLIVEHLLPNRTPRQIGNFMKNVRKRGISSPMESILRAAENGYPVLPKPIRFSIRLEGTMMNWPRTAQPSWYRVFWKSFSFITSSSLQWMNPDPDLMMTPDKAVAAPTRRSLRPSARRNIAPGSGRSTPLPGPSSAVSPYTQLQVTPPQVVVVPSMGSILLASPNGGYRMMQMMPAETDKVLDILPIATVEQVVGPLCEYDADVVQYPVNCIMDNVLVDVPKPTITSKNIQQSLPIDSDQPANEVYVENTESTNSKIRPTRARSTVTRFTPTPVVPAQKSTDTSNRRVSITKKSLHQLVDSTESKPSTCSSSVDTNRQIVPRVTRSRSKLNDANLVEEPSAHECPVAVTNTPAEVISNSTSSTIEVVKRKRKADNPSRYVDKRPIREVKRKKLVDTPSDISIGLGSSSADDQSSAVDEDANETALAVSSISDVNIDIIPAEDTSLSGQGTGSDTHVRIESAQSLSSLSIPCGDDNTLLNVLTEEGRSDMYSCLPTTPVPRTPSDNVSPVSIRMWSNPCSPGPDITMIPRTPRDDAATRTCDVDFSASNIARSLFAKNLPTTFPQLSSFGEPEEIDLVNPTPTEYDANSNLYSAPAVHETTEKCAAPLPAAKKIIPKSIKGKPKKGGIKRTNAKSTVYRKRTLVAGAAEDGTIPPKRGRKRTKDEKLRDGIGAMTCRRFRALQETTLARKIAADVNQRMLMHQEEYRQVQQIMARKGSQEEKLEKLSALLLPDHRDVLYLLSLSAEDSSVPAHIRSHPLRKSYRSAVNMIMAIEAYASRFRMKPAARTIFRTLAKSGGSREEFMAAIQSLCGNEASLWSYLRSHLGLPFLYEQDDPLECFESVDLTGGMPSDDVIGMEEIRMDDALGPVVPKKGRKLQVMGGQLFALKGSSYVMAEAVKSSSVRLCPPSSAARPASRGKPSKSAAAKKTKVPPVAPPAWTKDQDMLMVTSYNDFEGDDAAFVVSMMPRLPYSKKQLADRLVFLLSILK